MFQRGCYTKKVWIRIIRLPLHFWDKGLFKTLRDSCGGFVAMDEDTTHR